MQDDILPNPPGYSFYYEAGDVFFNTPQQAFEYFLSKGKQPRILESGAITTMEFNPSRITIYHDIENPNKIVCITGG